MNNSIDAEGLLMIIAIMYLANLWHSTQCICVLATCGLQQLCTVKYRQPTQLLTTLTLIANTNLGSVASYP